jgi:hypothetical protein
VTRWQFHGLDLVRRSLDEGAGVVLASNHSRWADPVVLAMLGLEIERYFYYIVSYHLFKQSLVMGWWTRRLGGYSIWREGADRESIRESARILANAERPLVLFPEGTWFRQNDRLGPLQEGLGLILRQAAKACDRPLRIHPVALKYWALDDPRPELARRLGRLERRLGWVPQDQLELLPRIEKLGGVLLAIKEIEHFGQPRTGPLDARISALAESWVVALEKFYFAKNHDGQVLERIRRLRLFLSRRLIEKAGDSTEVERIHRSLDTLLFCENLSAHSLDYLHERPSLERLTETVQRLEETVTDQPEEPVGHLGITATVGPALDGRTIGAALIPDLAAALQELLDRLLSHGPPPAWNAPPRVDTP